MARPVNADARATRRRILDSALVLFAERGPGGSPIREIARSAGVSLAMVHHYFGNKDGLYDACIDTMYADLAEMRDGMLAEAMAAQPAGLAQVLERSLRRGYRFARDHQPAMRMLLRQVVESGELDAERRERFQLPFLAEATALLTPGDARQATQTRLSLQTLIFTLARYSVSSDRELLTITGTDDVEVALAAVEDHLAAAGRALLPLGAGQLGSGKE